MALVLYFVYTIVKVYLFNPAIVREIKVPPILPLVPYLPQVFQLQFLPPFYFTYWIIILAIIAITHEMAHGIFAAYDKVRIKTTGFGFFPYFLPIFMAAFVEPDEKMMAKKKRFSQLTILSAGTFANVITAGIFLVVLIGFFSAAFAPSGIVFDTYAVSKISIAGISMVNGIPVANASYAKILNLSNSSGFNDIIYNNQSYLATEEVLANQTNNTGEIVVYNDAPAIRNNLSSIITKINGIPITSTEKLQEELTKYRPGDNVTITEVDANGSTEKRVMLEERPDISERAWLGVGFYSQQPTGIVGGIVQQISSFKSSNVYYQPKLGEASTFIYNLLWWIVIISISVALVNMLPVGIFDGGRFFYLTVLGITKSEKAAKRAFVFSTYLFLFILLLLMILWFFSLF